MKTLEAMRVALEGGAVTAEGLLDACLAEARDPAGEGGRVFIELSKNARARAREMDGRRTSGKQPSAWAGIPISIKDLFDVAGQVTRAGSVLLNDAEPASITAPAIARLEAAGFVIVGRTNMTEFAYSGVGMNPHYGTPRNPFDRAMGRIPGGSSAGAAVSVTDGMAIAAIGTDTGGSCRIPAALTGITGFKPTASRIPLDGVYPLSPSLDSVGPLAASSTCCAILDDIMGGGDGWVPAPLQVADLRFAVLEHYVTDDLDEAVAADWGRTIARLVDAGAELEPMYMPDIETLPELNARGGIAAAEAFAFHRAQLGQAGSRYDPRVGSRIRAGQDVDPEELADLHATRRAMVAGFAKALDGFDALLMPTVPIVAPALDAFSEDVEYARLNLLLLRNPSLFNFLDGCAISIPMHKSGEPPTGLMLAGPAGHDRHLFSASLAVEAVLAERTG